MVVFEKKSNQIQNISVNVESSQKGQNSRKNMIKVYRSVVLLKTVWKIWQSCIIKLKLKH